MSCITSSPIQSPFESYYKENNVQTFNSRKRGRGTVGQTTWDPSLQKKVKKDMDHIYSEWQILIAKFHHLLIISLHQTKLCSSSKVTVVNKRRFSKDTPQI